MVIRVFCLMLLLFGSLGVPRAASPSCCSSSPCCRGEHPRCPMLPNGTCAISAVDQRVAMAIPAINQFPPLTVQVLEPVDIESPSIQELLAASPAHPPPLFLLLQSFRN